MEVFGVRLWAGIWLEETLRVSRGDKVDGMDGLFWF